jgi:UDP-N-acetylmuramyl-tripeptide synthetase
MPRNTSISELFSNVLNNKSTIEIIANNNENTQITGISSDSRTAVAGEIFFCLEVNREKAIKYLNQALENNIQIIVATREVAEYFIAITSEERLKEIVIVKAQNVENLLLSTLKYYYQPLPKNIYAVTGTNGKSSIVDLIRQMLNLIDIQSASIGTIGVIVNQNKIEDSPLTTPDITSIYRTLFNLKSQNINDVAIEVSSIGLTQNRIAGLNLSTAIFSNFTQDHLDYHKTMAEYFAAKMQLFNRYSNENTIAILNRDIEQYQEIATICNKNQLSINSYGKNICQNELETNNISIKILAIKQYQSYQEADIIIKIAKEGVLNSKIRTKIIGEFQIYNILASLIAIINQQKLDLSTINKLINQFIKLNNINGRMELIGKYNNASIYIDYAHTPDALLNSLKSAKEIIGNQPKDNIKTPNTGKIIVLFGCGGNRDKEKRPIMGEIASKYADLVIITEDNPRNEDPKAIRTEIISGCNLDKTIEIANRKEAIAKAIKMLENNDLLIIAGKGHEQYQIIGDIKYYFDEKEIIKKEISMLSGN